MFSSQQINRHIRKYELNKTLSALPVFHPLTNYHIYHINQSTSSLLLHNLIEQARNTTRFTIDTEDDYYTHQPALIQIEFLQQQSMVLLIEINHLPHATSVIFWLIRSLMKVIFNPTNSIFSWGDAKDELGKFIPSEVFSYNTLEQIKNINVQKTFKKWHNRILKHRYTRVHLEVDKALYSYSHKLTDDFNHKWSLQMAIAYTFYEFLDKSRTKSRWSRNLEVTHTNKSFLANPNKNHVIQEMIQYAVNDCLAVTKIVLTLKLDQIEA